MQVLKFSYGGQALVVEPDGYWHKGLAKALCGVLRRDKSVAERAPHLHWLIIEGTGGVVQDSVQLLPHPPLCNHVQIVQFSSNYRAGLPHQLV